MFYLVNIFFINLTILLMWSCLADLFCAPPGPHSMLVENRSFFLKEQRTLCGALNLRQHEIASSYTCDWPTRKCSTHPIIMTIKRPYFNNRLRPKFVLFRSFLTTFAHTTLSWVRGNGRDRFSLMERPSSFNAYEDIARGPGNIAKIFARDHGRSLQSDNKS